MNDLSPPSTFRPGAAAPEAIRVEYVPRKGLLGLTLVNLLLTVVTLTMYRFWAKTKVRKHIWSCVHVNGEPLEYTGKGMELFKGFLVVFGLFLLPFALIQTYLQVAMSDKPWAVGVAFGMNILLLVVISVFWGFALYRARRYQLSRTHWRGIRGTMTGSAMSFTFIHFGAVLLRSMTLGWSTPAMNLNIQERMIGDMRFGSQPFRFRGRAGPLYKSYAICWFGTGAAMILLFVAIGGIVAAAGEADWVKNLFKVFEPGTGGDTQKEIESIVILVFIGLGIYLLFPIVQGIIWSFYIARELQIFASYTTFGPARFHMDATAGSLIGLVVGNLMILIFTLGIGMPYIQQRLVRYLCDRIAIEGLVDVDLIAQSTATMDTRGEGLADAFDVGGI